MSDNTLQFEWIVTIKEGLAALFADREDVFVAGDLLWYYEEGNNKLRVAPDAMVAFGRPRGNRGSYKQWQEGGVCPQVVFEVLSPGNRFGEMLRKLRLYERLGVEEYYVMNPGDRDDPARVETLDGWHRSEPEQPFTELESTEGWRSPRLGVTFESTQDGRLRLVRPDGRPFETFVEVSQRADVAQRAAVDAQRVAADAQRVAVDAQRAAADAQRVAADAQRVADAESRRADLLAARLRAAGIDPDAV